MMNKLQLRRLPDSMQKKWPDRLLKRRKLGRRLPIRRKPLLVQKRKRSKKRWLEGGKKKRKTERDRRLRLPSKDRSRSRRLSKSNRNSKHRSRPTSSEKMMSPSNVESNNKCKETMMMIKRIRFSNR